MFAYNSPTVDPSPGNNPSIASPSPLSHGSAVAWASGGRCGTRNRAPGRTLRPEHGQWYCRSSDVLDRICGIDFASESLSFLKKEGKSGEYTKRYTFLSRAIEAIGRIPYSQNRRISPTNHNINIINILNAPYGTYYLDCSSFVAWCYNQVPGVPKKETNVYTGSMVKNFGEAINFWEMKPGDILFSERSGRHVVIFLGWAGSLGEYYDRTNGKWVGDLYPVVIEETGVGENTVPGNALMRGNVLLQVRVPTESTYLPYCRRLFSE